MAHDIADSTTLIGALAGTLTTLSFVPQVVKTWQARSAAGLSVWMVVTFDLGIMGWLAYGILTRAWPVIVANAVTLTLGLALLGLTLRYR